MVEMVPKAVLMGRAVAGSPETATIAALPLAARFVLQLDPAADAGALGPVAGFDLSGPLNTVRGTGDRLAARLGPYEWLLIGPEAETEALQGAISDGLGGTFHSLVDVSHRNAAIALSGPAVADVLNAGCPLDLAESAFPKGSATRTILGKAEIALMRPEGSEAWRLECWRSFAPYVHAFLTEAAR